MSDSIKTPYALRGLVAGLMLWGGVVFRPLGAAQPGEPLHLESPISAITPELQDDATLRSVYFVDSMQGWAVGDRGTIVYTPDGGAHWLNQSSTVGCTLRCVRFSNTKDGWAVGGWIEPDTQISRGVVLRTFDGGQTWESLAQDLPGINAIQLLSDSEAIVATDPSTVYLTNRLITLDGGKSWQPVPSGSASAATAIHQIAGQSVTLTSAGVIDHATHHTSEPEPVFADPQLRALAPSAAGLLAAGSEGRVVYSDRSGRRWRALRLTAGAVRPERYDFHCLAASEQTCWAAGIPGDRIFRIQTDGNANAFQTGTHLPLYGIHFADSVRGWACGAMGLILSTIDGGQTWHPQRAGKRRAALLVVGHSGTEFPWSLVVHESLEHGLRSVICTSPEQSTGTAFCAMPCDCIQSAGIAAGASDSICAALPEDPQAMRSEINQILATYNPLVVVIHEDVPSSQQTAWIDCITHAPAVGRAFKSKRSKRGEVVYHPSAILPGAGLVSSDAWLGLLSMVSPGADASGPIAVDRFLDRENDISKIDSVTHGMPVPAGGQTRRIPPAGSRMRLASLQPQSQYQEWISRLLDATDTASHRTYFQTRVAELLRQIGDRERPVFLRRLILETARRQAPDLFLSSLRIAARELPEQTLGRTSELLSLALGGSQEFSQLPQHLRSDLEIVNAPQTRIRSVGSPFSQPVVAQVSEQLPNSTRTILPLQSRDLVWSYHPQVLLSQVALLGAKAESGLVSTLARVSVSDQARHWMRYAKEELFVRGRQSLDSVAADTNRLLDTASAGHPAQLASQPPVLDGRFDEAIWKSLTLAPERATWAMAYDHNYVYIAIRNGFPGGELTEPADQRTRDENLDPVQRISLQIDVDRDLLSSFRLEIDPSGRCRDSCNGFPQWQPMWFIKISNEPMVIETPSEAAGTRTQQCWNAEIAIRRQDLFRLPLLATDAWRFRLSYLESGQTVPVGIEQSDSRASKDWNLVTFSR